jgi:hypothetical protein
VIIEESEAYLIHQRSDPPYCGVTDTGDAAGAAVQLINQLEFILGGRRKSESGRGTRKVRCSRDEASRLYFVD